MQPQRLPVSFPRAGAREATSFLAEPHRRPYGGFLVVEVLARNPASSDAPALVGKKEVGNLREAHRSG
jgi:hypothetical protein